MGKINFGNFKKLLKKKSLLVALAILAIAVILGRTMGDIQRVLFKKKPPKEAAEIEMIGEATPVKVYKVRRMSFKDTLPVMGNIKGFKEVDLKFETNGIIESFNFEEGEKIQEGDIIANLNQRDALLKLKYAELEAEKSKKLFDIGGVDKIKYEQAKLEYESAKSDFEKTNIYAVTDGLLGSRDIDVGTYVTPNDKVGTFVDIASVYAEFKAIEKDSPKLKLGQKCEIFVDAYPNKSYKATIDSVSPIVEGRTRTQNIKVELKNSDSLLKPGMFARALISTYENENALIIPTSAFVKKDADYFVYVVHKEEIQEKPVSTVEEEKKGKKKKSGKGVPEEGKRPKGVPSEAEGKEPVLETGVVEMRKVDIEYLTQDAAEISKGLSEGDLIIVEAYQEFKDKEKVEVSEVQETLF